MSEGVLPCWCCFKEGAQMYVARGKFYINCPHCHIITPPFSTSAGVANWWNEKYLKCKEARTKWEKN